MLITHSDMLDCPNAMSTPDHHQSHSYHHSRSTKREAIDDSVPGADDTHQHQRVLHLDAGAYADQCEVS